MIRCEYYSQGEGAGVEDSARAVGTSDRNSDFRRQIIRRHDELVPEILEVQRRLRKLKKELRGLKILLEVASPGYGQVSSSLRATLVSIIRQPMTVDEIAEATERMGLHVGGERPRSNLCSVLASLAREGHLQRVGRAVYAPAKPEPSGEEDTEGRVQGG